MFFVAVVIGTAVTALTTVALVGVESGRRGVPAPRRAWCGPGRSGAGAGAGSGAGAAAGGAAGAGGSARRWPRGARRRAEAAAGRPRTAERQRGRSGRATEADGPDARRAGADGGPLRLSDGADREGRSSTPTTRRPPSGRWRRCSAGTGKVADAEELVGPRLRAGGAGNDRARGGDRDSARQDGRGDRARSSASRGPPRASSGVRWTVRRPGWSS